MYLSVYNSENVENRRVEYLLIKNFRVMNKMIKFFRKSVDSYCKNVCEHQSLRITGDCTPNLNAGQN